jgi:hypothetical protein
LVITAGDRPRGRAEELPQRRREIPGREAVQVQQRQHLGDLRGASAPRRQDRRGEPPALAGLRVDAAVVHARRDDPDRPCRGQHLAGLMAAVAHHQPPARLVALIGELGDVVLDLGLQRCGQHPPRTITDDLVDHRGAARPRVARLIAVLFGARNYGEHRSYLPDRRCRAGLA